MIRDCKNCGKHFEIYDEDLAFYEKVSPVLGNQKFLISLPTFCPDCRQMRRLTYRNERNFYKRKCDLTGENLISVYPQDFSGKVVSHEFFYGDKWNPLDYGQDFDFSRPFFEQYLELSFKSPRLCTVNVSSENSTYTNHCGYNKNCYMCINSGYSEDLLYCTNYSLYDKDCVDCLAAFCCEKCYFCVELKNAQSCTFSYQCAGIDDCHFCFDCRNCSSCFGCYNLRQKKYCIFNKHYSEEEYQKKLGEIMPKNWQGYMEMFEKWKTIMRDEALHKNLNNEKCQDSDGDHLEGCKNVKDTFYAFESEDCRYCWDAGKLKNCYDCTEPFTEELNYELQASFNGYHNLFSIKNIEAKNTIYCQYCIRSQDCLGCFGMHKGQYRIFNKQYSKEEYEKLAAKIISHMQKTGEWGEFFPIKDSPFAYNETVANDYYPLEKEEILNQGWKWRELEIPHSDSSLENVLKCEVSGRPFRLVKAEESFYEKMGLPVPQRCFDERLKMRLALRNPRKMRETSCEKCGKEIKTTCPFGVKHIYCEGCYLKEVY